MEESEKSTTISRETLRRQFKFCSPPELLTVYDTPQMVKFLDIGLYQWKHEQPIKRTVHCSFFLWLHLQVSNWSLCTKIKTQTGTTKKKLLEKYGKNWPVSDKAPWILGTNEIIESSRIASDNTELVTPGPPLTEDLPVPTFKREICNTNRPCAFWKKKMKYKNVYVSSRIISVAKNAKTLRRHLSPSDTSVFMRDTHYVIFCHSKK